MFVALFCGMIVSALAFRFALQPYAPLRLVKVIQSAAVFVALLNGVAIYKQEAFGGVHAPPPTDRPSFAQAIAPILGAAQARRTLAMLALGSAAFGLQEVLVEPFGGQVMHMSVASTTALTGMVGAGSLIGYAVAAKRRPGGSDPYRLAALGALAGVPAFAAVILAAPLGAQMLLQAGMAGVGFSAGLFGVAAMNATLALALRRASPAWRSASGAQSRPPPRGWRSPAAARSAPCCRAWRWPADWARAWPRPRSDTWSCTTWPSRCCSRRWWPSARWSGVRGAGPGKPSPHAP